MAGRWMISAVGGLALMLSACGGDDSSGGGGGGTAPGTGTGTTPAPTPISFTSATTANVAENSTGTAYQVTYSGGSGTPTYALTGADAAAFSISTTGAITFRTPPNFERPADADGNNAYLVTVQVSDSTGTASRDVSILVTNVADEVVISPFGTTYTGLVSLGVLTQEARVLAAQADGTIYSVDPTTRVQGNPYLTITGSGQRQLLSVAAAPDAASSGLVYVSVLTTTGIEVRRYRRGDPTSEDLILRVPLPSATTQNVGGWIGFGSDNLLYVATGSAATDATTTPPPNTSLLGKVLRIDPSRDDFPADPARDYAIPTTNPFVGGGGAGEVYANGFRDPRSGNFDGTNLYLSDRYETFAGGSAYIYLVRPADAGRTFAPPGGASGTLPPVLSASNSLTLSGTLVAGPVYRGVAPDLVGSYIFGARGGTGANTFAGVYRVGAATLVPGTTQAPRGCCTLIDGNVPVAFAGTGNPDLYFATDTGLFVLQYR